MRCSCCGASGAYIPAWKKPECQNQACAHFSQSLYEAELLVAKNTVLIGGVISGQAKTQDVDKLCIPISIDIKFQSMHVSSVLPDLEKTKEPSKNCFFLFLLKGNTLACYEISAEYVRKEAKVSAGTPVPVVRFVDLVADKIPFLSACFDRKKIKCHHANHPSNSSKLWRWEDSLMNNNYSFCSLYYAITEDK